MCERTQGNFFEPPSLFTCDRVIIKAVELAKADGVVFEDLDDPKRVESYLDDAAELIHPEPAGDRWDYFDSEV